MLSQLFKQLNTIEKKVFWAIVLSLFLSILAYGYLVNATIVNIVLRKSIEQEAGRVSSAIGDFESEYSSLRNHLNHKHAYSLGFNDPEIQTFALRKHLVKNVPVIY